MDGHPRMGIHFHFQVPKKKKNYLEWVMNDFGFLVAVRQYCEAQNRFSATANVPKSLFVWSVFTRPHYVTCGWVLFTSNSRNSRRLCTHKYQHDSGALWQHQAEAFSHLFSTRWACYVNAASWMVRSTFSQTKRSDCLCPSMGSNWSAATSLWLW